MKELEENITPSSITGMGPVLLPTATQVGSGDVPANSGDAEEEYKKKKKKKKMKKLQNFESFTNKDIVTEGRVKQFTSDLKDMIKDIKRGYGWIDPEFVEDTWENSSDSIDFELVKSEIYRQLIKAGLLAKSDDDNEEEAGEYIKSLKQLGIAESETVDVIDEVNEAKFFRLPNKLNAMWDLKNSVDYIVGKHDAGNDYNPADMRTIEEFIKKIKQSAKSFKDAEEVKGTVYESLVTEAKSFSEREIKATAGVVADAVAKVEGTKAEVIEFETLDKDGKIAGFYIQKASNKKGAPSRYWITDSGEVVSAFRHDTFGDGVVAQVGDKLASVVKAFKANESVVNEAKFVKDFNRDVLKAKTKEEVLELYPNAKFFTGKSDHFFGELDGNLFFKAYYTKAQKEFEIKSVYSEKGSNYVHLYNESVVVEAAQKSAGLVQFAADEKAEGKNAEIHLAFFDGSGMEAQSTNKTWDDGVPVTKNFTRGGYKRIAPKGEIYIIESNDWWYFKDKGTWYAVKRKDYGTPPFEY